MNQITHLTFEQVADLRHKFLEMISFEEKIIIDLGALQEIDVAGLQLLVSCIKTATESGKEIILNNGTDGILNKALAVGLDLPVVPA